jgi:lysyl-tRNA synthetase class I|tara:strand:- start:3546 stop:3863 length:318 start_codon:yes stop_codon:yes gene_type:complete
MNRQNKDYSVEEIIQMLRNKQGDIQGMDSMTNNSRDKLKKINEQMDEQQKVLELLVMNITQVQSNVDDFDKYNKEDDVDFSNEIQKVINNLRSIRKSLAYLIQKQ